MPEGQAFKAIGQPLRRKEDLRLLAGDGRFSDDRAVPFMAHAVMVRSPYPHARDQPRSTRRRARAMPGVLAVLTGADCAPTAWSPFRTSRCPRPNMT